MTLWAYFTVNVWLIPESKLARFRCLLSFKTVRLLSLGLVHRTQTTDQRDRDAIWKTFASRRQGFQTLENYKKNSASNNMVAISYLKWVISFSISCNFQFGNQGDTRTRVPLQPDKGHLVNLCVFSVGPFTKRYPFEISFYRYICEVKTYSNKHLKVPNLARKQFLPHAYYRVSILIAGKDETSRTGKGLSILSNLSWPTV